MGRRSPQIPINLDNLKKKMKNAIENAKGFDDDYIYITVGEAKLILKKIEECESNDLARNTEIHSGK